MSTTLSAYVHALRFEAEDITSIELRPVEGVTFPPGEAGAHIDLQLPNGLLRRYSLVNAPGERGRYLVAVLKDRASRGGSVVRPAGRPAAPLGGLSSPRPRAPDRSSARLRC